MFALHILRIIERTLLRHAVCDWFSINQTYRNGLLRENDGLALVLICRDVADYIDEWIGFHVLAGVRHFYIYNNNSVDGTAKQAIMNRTGNVSVTVHPWELKPLVVKSGRWKKPEIAIQELAYAHAILNYGERHKWMSFIDIDEFLIPVRHDTLPDALEQLKAHSNISLPWFNFGHCGHKTRPPKPVVYSYNLRHQLSDREIDDGKCILHPSKITTVGLHEFETSDMGQNTVDDSGRAFRIRRLFTKDNLSNNLIQLNHYATKSAEEHKISLERGHLHGISQINRRKRFYDKRNRLDRDTCQDNAASNFLKRHGISNATEFQAYMDKRKTNNSSNHNHCV